MKKKKVITR